MGLDARLVSFVFACLPVLCIFRFVFYYRKKQVMIILLRAEENRGGETTNGDTNQVDEVRNRRNPLKINTFQFGSIATRWG